MLRWLAIPSVVVLCLSRGAAAPGDLRSIAREGVAAIRAPALQAHVRFLADDLLEGRGTGSTGHAIAARYVATTFASLGPQPAGDAGSFLQAVPLRGATLDRAASSLAIDGAALAMDEQVIV